MQYINYLFQITIKYGAHLVFVLMTVFLLNANASSIQQLDFNELADMAELVFEGQVIAKESRWNERHTKIHTYINFRVDDVIKGQYKKRMLKLRFAGGIVGEEELRYQGMIYPTFGEQGIYFVETLNRQLINPLVGWQQGHFLIKNMSINDTVEQKMMTVDHRPLHAIKRMLNPQVMLETNLSNGRARGVEVSENISDAMSKSDFKNRIKNIVVRKKK